MTRLSIDISSPTTVDDTYIRRNIGSGKDFLGKVHMGKFGSRNVHPVTILANYAP
jgi:hypothetical protein